MTRLAVVVSHPIQYYAPWFRQLAQRSGRLDSETLAESVPTCSTNCV